MYAKLAFLNGEVFDTKQYTAAQLAALNAANGTNFVASDSANASDHLPVLALFRVGFAPIITKTAREAGFRRRIKVCVECNLHGGEFDKLSSWTTAQPSNQIIAEGNGTQTIRRLFRRRRVYFCACAQISARKLRNDVRPPPRCEAAVCYGTRGDGPFRPRMQCKLRRLTRRAKEEASR